MNNEMEPGENEYRDLERRHQRGKVMGGLLIVAIGALFLARELGAPLPFWILSWKTLLIALGIVSAVKHRFLHPGWIILVGVGVIFLVSDLYPEMNIKPIMWPILLMLVGLFIMLKPRKKHYNFSYNRWHKKYRQQHEHWQQYQQRGQMNEEGNNDDYVESTVVMAGVKKNILSKRFKGGEITNIFGGTELNLMQADIEERARLDVTQVFGGTKLIVPANWQIKSELVTVFGSVEDKRPNIPTPGAESEKVLVLTGDTIFGGIEIRSY